MRRILAAASLLLLAGTLAHAQPADLPSPFQPLPDPPTSSLPLPAGAATEAKQDAGTAAINTLLTNTQLRASPVPVSGTFFQATQPVSLTTLPALSAGAATIGAVNQAGTWNVGVTGPVAVTGTFFQATQPVSLTSLPALATGGNVIGAVTQSGSWTVAVTGGLTNTELRATAVPVSAASLPLPDGAATATNQATANGSLSSIDGKIPALGQAAIAASVPVAIASNQSAVPVSGTFWQATQPISGNVGVTGSAAVTGTFWQATQPVSLATLPALVAGAALIGKVGIDQTTDGTTNLVAAKQNGAWNITNVSGTISLPTGAATAAKQPALGTGGTPSADVITVQGAASGTPIPVNTQGTKATYRARFRVDIPASATDFVELKGSATKTVRITKISLSGFSASAASIQEVFFILRSTAISGGTPSSVTIAKLDSANATATAVSVQNTGVATAGTLVSILDEQAISLPLKATPTFANVPILLNFGDSNGQAVVLRGTSEFLAMGFGGLNSTTAVLVGSIEWTEE